MKKLILSFCVLLSSLATASPVFKPWLGEEKLFKAAPIYEYRHFSKVASNTTTYSLTTTQHLLGIKLQVALNPHFEILAKGELLQSKNIGLKVSEGMLATRYQLTSDIVGDWFSSSVNFSVLVPNRAFIKNPRFFYHGDADGELSFSIGKEYSKGKYWLIRYWGFAGLGFANDSKPWGHYALGAVYNMNSYLHFYLFADAYQTFATGDLQLVDFKGYGRVAQKSCDLFAGVKWFEDYHGYLTGSIGKRIYARNGPKDTLSFRIAYTFPFSL